MFHCSRLGLVWFRLSFLAYFKCEQPWCASPQIPNPLPLPPSNGPQTPHRWTPTDLVHSPCGAHPRCSAPLANPGPSRRLVWAPPTGSLDEEARLGLRQHQLSASGSVEPTAFPTRKAWAPPSRGHGRDLCSATCVGGTGSHPEHLGARWSSQLVDQRTEHRHQPISLDPVGREQTNPPLFDMSSIFLHFGINRKHGIIPRHTIMRLP